MTARLKKVLLVEDHSMVREGLAAIIRADPRLQVAGIAGTCLEASQFLESHPVDVVVIDFQLPDESGVELIRRHTSSHPDIRWVLLTMHKHPAVREEAFRAGAHSFVLKDSTCDDLIDAILDALSLSGIGTQPPLFSQREKQVLKAVAHGMTSKEIATELQLSVKTVETYRERLMRKSGARNSAELTRFAIEIGTN